jgi:hypothetical protein
MPNKKNREKQLKLCNIFDSSEVGRDYSDIGQNLPGSSLPCRNLPKNLPRLAHPELWTLLITKEPGYEAVQTAFTNMLHSWSSLRACKTLRSLEEWSCLALGQVMHDLGTFASFIMGLDQNTENITFNAL